MAKIIVLSQPVADKIAAGEVVERPAAVVKELVENSIDAGASEITVEIKNGGITYISVSDNGKGIPSEELETAFLRHATSKIKQIEDLFEINTMGFRGEALASIAAVSSVSVVSRTKEEESGTCMKVKHGKVLEKEEVVCNYGTTMVVENLFSNVPARMKFLKKDSTEGGYITDILSRIALSSPDISFRYILDGKEVFSTSGDGKLKNAILSIYGIEHARALYEVDYTEHGIRVFGAAGKAELARGNRTRQTLIVNGRYIKNHVVSKVVEEAYRNILMTSKFPFFVLNINLSPGLVDVNVHPAKTEIKFANEKEVYGIVNAAIKNAIYSTQKAEQEKNALGSQLTYSNSAPSSKENVDEKIVREFMERTIPSKNVGGYFFKEPKNYDHSQDKGAFSENGLFDQGAEITFNLGDSLKKEDPQIKNDGVLNASENVKEDFPPIIETLDKSSENAVGTKVVGQLFGTFIIAEKGNDAFIIDQHAAHERKRFEILKEDYLKKRAKGQQLLVPIVIDADMMEIQTVLDNQDFLKDIGFFMEEFGKGSVIIRETPFIGDEEEIKALALEVIAALIENCPMGVLSFEERILDMISCRYAIKANKRLNMLEMEGLIRDVEELEAKGIFTCPHGRPIKISFSKKDLEKGFKRIV